MSGMSLEQTVFFFLQCDQRANHCTTVPRQPKNRDHLISLTSFIDPTVMLRILRVEDFVYILISLLKQVFFFF